MHKINIVAVGNLKEKYWLDATNEYIKRLSRFASVEIREVPEFSGASKSSIEQIKDFECAKIQSKLDGYVISMDKDGKMLTSEQFSELIDKVFASGNSTISFVIGGSHGLNKNIREQSKEVVSFGKITFPHQLMRIVLLEQVYRAETILHNISYHK